MDVQIGEVMTEVVINEAVGSLSPEEIQRLVKIVLEHLEEQKNRAAGRDQDTAIRDRAFHPGR